MMPAWGQAILLLARSAIARFALLGELPVLWLI